MNVILVNKPTLEFTDWAIGECYNKGCYTDPEKVTRRVHKVANVNKHSSVLEFTDYIFEITADTKTLLAMTRHRHANYAVKSSRYTLDKSDLIFERTGDTEVDKLLEEWRVKILEQLGQGKKNDVVDMMLPQAYQYRWVVKFNARSLQNFFKLRLDKHAHYKIREVAEAMLEQVPKGHRFLFMDKVIKESKDV